MRKPIVLLGAIALVAASWTIGSAFATNLSTGTASLSGNGATIARCDTDGIATVLVNAATPPYNATAVTLSGIASTCGSEVLNVTVNNGLVTSTGTTTVPAGGGVVTVTLGTSIAVRDAMQTEVSLT
jgi:hypothetical protein